MSRTTNIQGELYYVERPVHFLWEIEAEDFTIKPGQTGDWDRYSWMALANYYIVRIGYRLTWVSESITWYQGLSITEIERNVRTHMR